MLTKRQIYLVIFAVLSVLLAVGTLFYLRELDRRLQEPLQEEFIYEETPVVSVSDSSSSSWADYLQEDFDALLSGETVADMYEGERDYGFTGSKN